MNNRHVITDLSTLVSLFDPYGLCNDNPGAARMLWLSIDDLSSEQAALAALCAHEGSVVMCRWHGVEFLVSTLAFERHNHVAFVTALDPDTAGWMLTSLLVDTSGDGHARPDWKRFARLGRPKHALPGAATKTRRSGRSKKDPRRH